MRAATPTRTEPLHKHSSFPLLALLACSLMHIGHAGAAETLREAVAAAVERFPTIQAAQHRRDAVRAQVGQARAEFLPTLNGSIGQGRERSRNVSTRAAAGDEVSLRRRESEVNATQLLFDGGAAGGQVRRFAARAEGADFNVLDTVEDVALRTAQVFVEVRRLREQLALARENTGAHERTLSDVSALADAGRGRRIDVVQAEARRALAASSADQLAGQLAQAEAAFRHLTGRPPGALAAPPSLEPELPAREEQAVNEAISGHPGVKAAAKEVDAAQYDRESARARRAMPRLTLEAGAARNRDVDGIAGPNQDQYAMLRLRYNFFRGFGDSERVRETEARIEEALAELARVRNDVTRDVRQAWEALRVDRSRLPQVAQYARASSDVADGYRLQFQLGQRTLLDVLNAENERFNALSGYVSARAAVTTDELRVLASQGRLVLALGLVAEGLQGGGSPTGASVRTCDVGDSAAAGCLALRLDGRLPEGFGLGSPLGSEPR
jgi:adhesin transport system outer membrane protein